MIASRLLGAIVNNPRHIVLNTVPAQTIRAKRLIQVQSSLPHYLNEILRLRRPSDIVEWLYYKFPTVFPLRKFPLAITIEITNECNFACPHCPRTALNLGRDVGFMPLETFRTLAKQCTGRVRKIKFIGLGEPALHPDLPAMMDILKGTGVQPILYTNGTLFERFSPTEICSWGVSTIVLSIDGVDERSFKRLRVGGDLPTIRANLARFRACRGQRGTRSPTIEIRHVIMPGETPAMLRKFRAEWRNGLGDTVKFNLLGPRYDKPRAEDPKRPSCRDIRREIHPRVDGRVPLCGYDGQQEWIGDLKTTSLEAIWNSPRLKTVRGLHQRRDLAELPFCKTCQFR